MGFILTMVHRDMIFFPTTSPAFQAFYLICNFKYTIFSLRMQMFDFFNSPVTQAIFNRARAEDCILEPSLLCSKMNFKTVEVFMMQPLMSKTHNLLRQFFFYFQLTEQYFGSLLIDFVHYNLQHRGILPAKLLCTLLCCKKRTELIVF